MSDKKHSLQMIRSRNSHIQTFTDIVQIPVTGMSRSAWLCHSSFVIRHVDINNHIQSLFFILTKTKILKTVCIRYDKIIHPCNQRDYQASQQGNLKSHIKYQITFQPYRFPRPLRLVMIHSMGSQLVIFLYYPPSSPA